MKQKICKISAVLITVVILSTMFVLPSSAYVAFNSYNFNYYGEAEVTPSGYSPVDVLYGRDLGVGDLSNATDVYVSPQNEVYILDLHGSANEARIHIFDENFKLIKTLTTLTANGHPYTMRLPESLVVDKNGYIYVCDTGNCQVLKLDKDKSGKIVQTIGAPKSDLFTGKFKPSKVAIAKNMSLYVIGSGTLDGIMEFNEKGVFQRYFGAPDVQMTLSDLVNLAWRKFYRAILGNDADVIFVTYVPTEFENLVVDKYGFAYAVIASSGESNTNQLVKMNFQGTNILDPTAKSTQKISTTLSETYGDLIRRSTAGFGNIFKDVAVVDDGFITMLDSNLCKVFEYDSEGNMTFVYGGKGNQAGLFNTPIAVAKLGTKTLVLDSYYGSLTVFDLTDYGRTLHEGIVLYNAGLYADAEDYWVEILKSNANCELAHIGIGKVYYQQGKYAEALKHFEIANDRMNYQDSFSLYREQVIGNYFSLIMTSILVLVILFILWRFFGKSIMKAIKNKKQGGDNDDIAESME